MLKVFEEFERRPDLLARFDALLSTPPITTYSSSVAVTDSSSRPMT